MKEKLPLINDKIRENELQLITHEGQNIGVVSRMEALQMAKDASLDLVVITEQGSLGIPVAKIMDFGKALYEKKKKQAEAKKKQKVIQIKEIKISPKISDHDYQIKMKQAFDFLDDGKRVKFTIFFKGRENMSKETLGTDMFDKINKTFEGYNLIDDLVHEKDANVKQPWSRIYYLRGK